MNTHINTFLQNWKIIWTHSFSFLLSSSTFSPLKIRLNVLHTYFLDRESKLGKKEKSIYKITSYTLFMSHQLMCLTPPSRCCFSSIYLQMAFLRSRTVADCTTTIAVKRFAPVRINKCIEIKTHSKKTHAWLLHQPYKHEQSWPDHIPKPPESSPHPTWPEDQKRFGILDLMNYYSQTCNLFSILFY